MSDRKGGKMNELQWRQTVEATKKGDKKAFEAIYRETEKAVYFTCLKLLANEDSAKDAMQDTFMTALDKLGSLDDGVKFPMWINRIAVNKCKDRFRKVTNDSLDEQLEQGVEISDDESFIPEEYVTDEVKRKVIMDIINTVLSDVQRQAIIMYYYDEMSLEEIAEVMECPVKTVSSRLCSAREKIREAVLIYEKQQSDRLHMLVPVPILTQILRIEAESISVPDISPMLLGTQLFNAAVNAGANTVSTTVVAGGSKMVGGVITGKIVAAIAAGVIAVGGATTAVVMTSKGSNDSSQAYSSAAFADTSSKADSSLEASDTSSKADTTSSRLDGSKTDVSSSKQTESSSKASQPDGEYTEWSVEDLSTFMDTNVKGKPIAEAQKAINEKFGTQSDKWESATGGKYTTYSQKLPISIKVYDTVFTEIWISEFGGSGTVDTKTKYCGFFSYYDSKVGADVAQDKLAKKITEDGFEYDKNTFMLMWLTKNGEVSIGANQYKTYRGRLGLVFWPRLTWGR